MPSMYTTQGSCQGLDGVQYPKAIIPQSVRSEVTIPKLIIPKPAVSQMRVLTDKQMCGRYRRVVGTQGVKTFGCTLSTLIPVRHAQNSCLMVPGTRGTSHCCPTPHYLASWLCITQQKARLQHDGQWCYKRLADGRWVYPTEPG